MKELLAAVARWYVCHSPIAFGKWRLSRRLDRYFVSNPRKTSTKVRGFRMELDTKDLVQRTLCCYDDLEPAIREEIENRLKLGDTLLDIGANVGFFSLCAAKAVGPAGHVFAFEPAPNPFATLRRNVALNGFSNIRIFDLALSDRIESVRLFLDGKQNSGASSLRQLEDNSDYVDIQSTTYDAFAEKNSIPVPALIKVDVEAAEVRVLRGMARLLSGSHKPPIIIEVSEGSLRKFGTSKDELFDLLKSYGYGNPALLSHVRRSAVWKDSVYFQYDALFTAL